MLVTALLEAGSQIGEQSVDSPVNVKLRRIFKNCRDLCARKPIVKAHREKKPVARREGFTKRTQISGELSSLQRFGGCLGIVVRNRIRELGPVTQLFETSSQ